MDRVTSTTPPIARSVPTAPDEQVVRVALDEGAVARGCVELQSRLPQLLAGGAHTVVVDVSDLDRLSSTTVAALLWVKRTCAARRIHVVLSQPTERALDVLTRTGLGDVFEIESRVS